MSKAISTRPVWKAGDQADKTSRCLQLLTALVREIESIRDRHPLAASSSSDLSQWSDENDLYLEAKLPGSLDLEADFCVQEGRVFIRLAK